MTDQRNAKARAAIIEIVEQAPMAPTIGQLGEVRVQPAATTHRLLPVLVAAAVIALLAVGWAVWPHSHSLQATDPTTPTTGEPGTRAAPAWSEMAAPDIEPRGGFVSVQTDDGWFVWGGWTVGDPNANLPDSAQDGAYYDGASNTWRSLPQSPVTNDATAATGVWTGSEVIVLRANGEPAAAAFDPTTFQWRKIAVPAEILAAWDHSDGGSFALGWQRFVGGRVVIVFNSGRVLRLDPVTDLWSIGAAAPVTEEGFLGIAVSPSQLFAVGPGQGRDDSVCTGTTPLYTYDVEADTWTTDTLPHGNWQPAIIASTGDQLLLAGGVDCSYNGSSPILRRAAKYDPTSHVWTAIADLTDDIPFAAFSPVEADGRIVAVGLSGRPNVYYPDLDAWWSGPALFGDNGVAMISMGSVGDRLLAWSVSEVVANGDGSFGGAAPEPTAWILRLPTTPPTPAASTTTTSTTAPGSPVAIRTGSCTYTVKAGDSPFTIAQQFGITVAELKEANIGSPALDTMVVGLVIILPMPCASPTATTTS